MSRRRKINWGTEDRKFSKYETYLAYLLGALSNKRMDGSIRMPLHPVLQREYICGQDLHRQGYIQLADDFDPHAFIARLKRDHELRRAAIMQTATGAIP